MHTTSPRYFASWSLATRAGVATLTAVAVLAFTAVATLGCASSSGDGAVASEGDPLRAPAFVDAEETLTADDLTRWIDMKTALARSFAGACPAGACGGTFDRVAPVRFTCSVAKATGQLAQCGWIFGESDARVTASTGAIHVDAKARVCSIPMATAPAVLAFALTAPSVVPAIARRIPGSRGTFFDALGGCIETAGAPPRAFADVPRRHVDLAAALPGDAPRDAWRGALAALDASFDAACGDSFCEGDYPDIASLGLACAVDRVTGIADGCVWSFAGASTRIAARSGAVHGATKIYRCPIATRAAATDLVSALAAAEATDPIHRPLPGDTRSLYDQLVGCL